MRNHFCPESCHCENYDACRCDGCGNNDIYKGEKKKISSIMRSALKTMIIEYTNARKIDVRFETHWRDGVDAEFVHFWVDERHIKMEICWDEVTNIYMTFERIVGECDKWLVESTKKIYIACARGNGKFGASWDLFVRTCLEAGLEAKTMYAEYPIYRKKFDNFLEKTLHTPKIEPLRRINLPTINKVIFNDPATIIMWADGTKTVVKADKDEFDPEKGMAMAIAKKVLGNQGNYYETFKKWLPKEDKLKKIYEDAKKQPGYAEKTTRIPICNEIKSAITDLVFEMLDSYHDNKKEDK